MLPPKPDTNNYNPSRRNQSYLVHLGLTLILALSVFMAMFLTLLHLPGVVHAAGEVCFATIEPSVTTTYSSTDAAAVRDAVAAASHGDTIKVAGTCAGTDTSGGQVVDLRNKDLTIRGAYTTSTWSSPQPGVYTTTLDAMQDGRVVYIRFNNIMLENLTLTGGQINGDGGGLYIRNFTETVTISNSIISNNSASPNGGGLFNQGYVSSKVFIINTLIHSNTASTYGGGIYNVQSPSVIMITNSTISSNTSQFGGGGVVNANNGQVVMTNTTISNNTATSSGGGVDNFGSASMTIVDSLIHNNTARLGGGIENETNGRVVLVNTTVNSNTAQIFGGAIYNANASHMVMTNTTFSHNIAPDSGMIINAHADTVVTMANSTVTSNSGNMIDNYGTFRVQNSIVAHTLSGNNCSGTITSNGYNLSSDTSCNFTNTGDQQSTNPLLGPLAANGGPSTGLKGEDSMLTHALLSGSPAIDMGQCGLSTDQRGETRPGSFTSLCDIGAYEAQEVTADVRLSKSVTPSTADPGEMITYTLTFSNSGDGLAQNVIITDEIPITITNVISTNSGATITPTGGITFAWLVEDLSYGEGGIITVVGQVNSALTQDTTVMNTAIITTNTTDGNSNNNTAQAVLNVYPKPDLSINKTASTVTPTAGEQLTYTIKISNLNSVPATGVVISDVVPSDTTYVQGSISGTGADATANPNLVWNVGTVTLGNPLTVTFAVTVDSSVGNGTQIVNTAAVSSSKVITSVADSATVTVGQSADLSISKSSQRQDSAITYTIVVTNEGPSAVNGAVVSDTIPTGIETVSWMWQCASSGGASCSAGPLNTNINDTVNLPVGGQLIYTVTATLPNSTNTIINTATVTVPADVTELTSANNTAVDTSSSNSQFIYIPTVLKN